MNSWSKRSRANLATCHPDLVFLFDHVLQAHDCSITCGYRNQEDQDKAFFGRPQRSKLQYPNGKHNKKPSIAVDVVPYIPEVGIDGDNPDHLKYFIHFAGIVRGIAHVFYQDGLLAHEVRWGGNWDRDAIIIDDQTFNDLYHFELVL